MGVATSIGDLWDTSALEAALHDVDIVVHCAGNPHFGNGAHYARDNTELTRHLIESIHRVRPGLQRLVLVSTIGAIDRPRGDRCTQALDEDSPPSPSSDYGRSKLDAEEVVRSCGLPHAIVRPTMVVGQDMRPDSHFAVFARAALQDAALNRLAWPGQFSIIHVDDLAAAIALVAVHQQAANKTYFCAGETASIQACFELARPDGTRIPLAMVSRLLSPLLRWAPFSVRALLQPALTASDASLRQLGWHPKYDAQAALATVIQREAARCTPLQTPAGQTVITGAASGLGRSLVDVLAPVRTQLLLIDRDTQGLEAVKQRHPHCRTLVTDLANEHEVRALTASPAWREHPVSELFACAGIGLKGAMQALPYASHRDMFAINVLARIQLAQQAAMDMQRQGFGRIVMISSSSAFQPLPSMGTYAATNSALLSLSESWSHELKPQGIHLMTVCPGGMQTNFQRNNGVRELENEKLMSPDDVAKAILKGLAQQRTTLVVSSRSIAMSLLARALPRTVSLKLWGRLMEKMR